MMARSTVIRGVIFPGRIAWEGRIAELLAAANGRTTLGGMALQPTTPEIDDAIEAIASGHAPVLAPDSTMTAWTWITLHNWYARVHVGLLQPRRCPVCQDWFLAFKKTQHTCRRLKCRTDYKKADVRQRVARNRQTPGARRQREQQRSHVTKNGT
jgi:hypothetical protein